MYVGLIVLTSHCVKSDEKVIEEVIDMVRQQIGPVAFFKNAVIVSKLPKTRSGNLSVTSWYFVLMERFSVSSNLILMTLSIQIYIFRFRKLAKSCMN